MYFGQAPMVWTTLRSTVQAVRLPSLSTAQGVLQASTMQFSLLRRLKSWRLSRPMPSMPTWLPGTRWTWSTRAGRGHVQHHHHMQSDHRALCMPMAAAGQAHLVSRGLNHHHEVSNPGNVQGIRGADQFQAARGLLGKQQPSTCCWCTHQG